MLIAYQENVMRTIKMGKSKFVVMDHKAVYAGYHQDLRIQKPESSMWLSFAIRKGVPLKEGTKHLAIQTKDHDTKGALFTGKIKKGEYGEGVIEKFDSGSCTILKLNSRHIVIDFEGSKIKGLYHMISTSNFEKGGSDNYLIFKGKKEV